jgi:hypothetical protein
VAGEIVVERDRDREALSATPRAHRIEQIAGADDAVVTAQVPQLCGEDVGGDGGEDLTRRVGDLRAADAMVDERDARARRGATASVTTALT